MVSQRVPPYSLIAFLMFYSFLSLFGSSDRGEGGSPIVHAVLAARNPTPRLAGMQPIYVIKVLGLEGQNVAYVH
jgi:hypothetical protein